MFDEHFHPSRRVAGHAEGFVVDAFVLVVGAAAEHGEDGSQHLMGQRDDGFFSAFANGQRIELVFERATRACSGLGELAQQPAHPSVAFANVAALAFARALVVARTDAYP